MFTIVRPRMLHKLAFALTSLARPAICFSILCFYVTSLSAQVNCPTPWVTSQNVYGMVSLSGNGSGSSGNISETAHQHVVMAGALAAQGSPAFCVWQATPFVNLGQMKSQGYENDVVTVNGAFAQSWTASGIGDPMWDSLSLQIIPNSGQYFVGAFSAIPGVLTTTTGTTNEDIILGAQKTSGGVSEPNQPFPTGAALLIGSDSYQSPPVDNAQGGGFANANWNVDWIFTPIPDGTCKDCQDKRGSAVSVRNQSLGEDIPIVGTGFSLHYESSRARGRAGADLMAIHDALSLGGWTLSVHHALQPLLTAYCAGGSCTSYSLVPKALFLGDGSVRNSADVQAPLKVGGNLQLTSEDGSEIYVFDGQTFLHTQTLLPMTGAVLYNFGYDANGLLITVTDGSGNVTTIQRDLNGHPTGIVSPYGQTTTISVDGNGYLSQVTDPMGNPIKLTTTAQGLLTSFQDANGNLYSFQYDSNGFLIKDSDPAGGVINLARTDNASGYSVTETTAQGRTSSGKVAFSNTSSSTTQTFTNTWTNGLQATETNSQQNGQLAKSASMPDGTSYAMTFGPDPRWGVQIPVLTSESFTRGNLTMNITGSRTATLANSADPFSLITQTDTQSINGRTYTSVFTAASKTFVESTPQGRKTTTVLDALERISTVQLPAGPLSTLAYDIRGRLATITQGSRQSTYTYDTNGHLASITDPINRIRSFTYDAAGRRLTTTLEDGRVINYIYDAAGNLTSITPPGSSGHTFTYSAVGLPTAYTPPLVSNGGATTYSYSPDREITSMTRPDGQTINYNYDSAGRMTSLALPNSTLSFAYDSTTGNLISAAVSGGESVVFSYNGQLPTGSTWTGTISGNVSRSFNNNFWVSSTGINGGNAIAYTYDKDGLVTKAGAMILKNNAKTGLYTGSTLGNVKDSFTYSAFVETAAYTAKHGTTVLYKAAYTRDNLGRIVGLKDTVSGATTSFSYGFDNAGRLTQVKKGSATVASYAYDSNSNRLSATTPSGTVNGTYDAQDRLLTYGTASFTYTRNGERATKTDGSQLTTYQYDVLGNLTGVTLPNGTQIEYIVDAENHRVGKKVNGVLVAGFLYDDQNLVAQLDTNNQLVSQFVYAKDGNSPDYMVNGGVTYRIFSDHLGSPRVVVNSATGAIVERIDYDEFGNVINDTNPGFQPFGFAGGLFDQDTKLVRFGARDYDAATGRWTAKDPTLLRGGDTNFYGYVLNDPINLFDPTGLEGEDCTCPKQTNPIINGIGGFVDAYVRDFNPFLGPLPYIGSVVAGNFDPASVLVGGPSMSEVARAQAGVSHWVDTNSLPYAGGEVLETVAAGGVTKAIESAPARAAARAAKSESLRNLKNLKNAAEAREIEKAKNKAGHFRECRHNQQQNIGLQSKSRAGGKR